MSAARAIARAEAAGVRLLLRPDGGVRMEAAAPPPADVLGELRRWRDDVARLLVARERQPECGPMPPAEHDAAEAAAVAAHYAAPPSARPYLPGDPDPVCVGLLLASRMRPPAWGDDTPPPPGAWCSCCGRHNPERGGRWWSPRNPRSDGLGLGPGWRCWTCHPPPTGCAVRVAET
jgi:hypothetical protein